MPSALGVFLPSMGLLSPIHGVITSSVLETSNGWRLHNLSGQPASLLGCPHGEKGFPYDKGEPLLFQLTFSCSYYLSSSHHALLCGV